MKITGVNAFALSIPLKNMPARGIGQLLGQRQVAVLGHSAEEADEVAEARAAPATRRHEERGQALGEVAPAGGHCGGQAGCLHVGLRAGEVYLDPSVLLRYAVLKPTRRPGPAPRAGAGG